MHMSTLVGHTNQISREVLGELTPDADMRNLAASVPVMATPAAVAAGVALTAAGFAAGYAAEEAADG
jgi:hypothetical protein